MTPFMASQATLVTRGHLFRGLRKGVLLEVFSAAKQHTFIPFDFNGTINQAVLLLWDIRRERGDGDSGSLFRPRRGAVATSRRS